MARPRKFDEQTVLTAARNLFWRKGYAATSVQELSATTGLGVQSLYGAFVSKRDLFLRVLGEYRARQAEGLEAALAADPSPWHGLTSAVTFEDGGRLDLPPEGCLLANSAAALSAQDEQVRALACEAYSETVALFVRQLTRAQEDGEIDAGLDAEQAARALVAVMQGVEFLRKSGIDEDELRLAKAAVLQMIESSVGR